MQTDCCVEHKEQTKVQFLFPVKTLIYQPVDQSKDSMLSRFMRKAKKGPPVLKRHLKCDSVFEKAPTKRNQGPRRHGIIYAGTYPIDQPVEHDQTTLQNPPPVGAKVVARRKILRQHSFPVDKQCCKPPNLCPDHRRQNSIRSRSNKNLVFGKG